MVTKAALTAKCRHDPRWSMLPPAGSAIKYHAITQSVATLGTLMSGAVIYGLWMIFPKLPYPWARWAEDSRADVLPFMSIGVGLLAYSAFGTLVFTLKTLRSVNSLPSP